LLFDRFTLFNGLNRSPAHITIPAVWSLVVVIAKPLIQILLELFDRSIEFIPEGFPEELIQDSPVESFHEAIGAGSGHLAPSMLNVIEFQENLVRMNHGATTILPAVVGQDMLHLKALLRIEGKHPVIEDVHCGLRELGGVEFPEGKGSKGVHYGLKVDPANALKGTHKKGIL
jgi:hypothetical protein